MIVPIVSADDPRLDPFRDLPARADKRSPSIIVESELAVARLLESAVHVRAVLTLESRASVYASVDTTVYTVAQSVLDAVAGFSVRRHAFALADRPSRSLEGLVAVLPESFVVVAASRVSDPANLGAIVRNCRAFGANGVLVDPLGADIYNRKAIRTAMGHVFAQSVVVTDLTEAIRALRRAAPDLRVVAATLSPRAVPLPGYALSKRTLLIVGNEGHGIAAELLALADDEVVIPMHDETDSLNVAAASAVLLYALQARPR